MELPPRNGSYAPTAKCSFCGEDMSMELMAEHFCGSVTGTTQYAEPQSLPFPSIINPQPIQGKPARPFVPRIDPFAPARHVQLGELTPSSSQDSFAASPVSAGSGRHSPFRMPPRKGSAPAIRRPPSPELLSQDCAFPPFPTSAKAKLSRNESKRGRTRTPDDARSIKSFERDAKRSASVGTHRSGPRHGTMDSSRPSTAASSRRPSISSTSESHKTSLNEIPPIPPLQQTLSNLNTASDPNRAQNPSGPWPFSPEASVQSSELETSQQDYFNHPENQGPRQEYSTEPEQGLENSFPPRIGSRDDPSPSSPHDETKEPMYKAKRPPPIVNPGPYATDNQVSTLKSRSPTAPLPSTPGSAIGRTLTGLFGRRRGQSTSVKKTQPQIPDVDSPRYKALAPEPEPEPEPVFPPHTQGQNNELNQYLDGDAFPPQEPSREGISRTIGAEADMRRPAEITQNDSMDSSGQPSMGIARELDKPLATIIGPPTIVATEQSAELSRASIDSASSYGSIGFTHSSASSRSTNPSELYPPRSSSNTGRVISQELDSITSTLAIRIPDIMPDSPTDPMYQPGKLAPVPEVPRFSESDSPEVATNDISTYNERAQFELTHPPPSARLRRPSTPGQSRGVCRGCSKMIMSGQKSMSSKDGRLSGRYHKECFVCKTCKSPFATADFYVHNDHPYCAHHYHVVNNTLCASCGKGIEGEYMETSNISGTGSKKFHRSCLRCATCKVVLQTDYFELSGRVYCEKDAFKLAHGGPRSPYDTAPSRPSPLNREYVNSSEPGKAVAGGRFPERRTTKLMMTY